MHSLLSKQTADGIKPMFNVVPPEVDEVASVLAGINPIYDDVILRNRLDNKTNLSKFQMSVGSSTSSCGQHVLDGADLIGIMDGSNIANGYNGCTLESIVGSSS